jgi:hypothetical protein
MYKHINILIRILGLGLPFMNIVQASKSILIGCNLNAFSKSIGILFAWGMAMIIILLVFYFEVSNKVKSAFVLHLYEQPEDIQLKGQFIYMNV